MSTPTRKAQSTAHAPRGGGRPGRRFEPWQIISAVAVLCLVAYFVYSEVSREFPVAQNRPPQGASSGGQVPSVDVGPFERAVEENPGDTKALLELANVLQDTREYSRAIGVYRKYLKLDPDNPDVDAARKRYNSYHVVSSIGDELRTNPFIRFDNPKMIEILKQKKLPTGSSYERFRSLMTLH